MPLVTVILTVFERNRFLEAALESALAQTVRDVEVIVTDDANSESTRRLCSKFSSDARVRYRCNPQTLGAPLNIAAALRESRGEFATILNDDDLMEPFMLERLLPPLRQSATCILAFGDHWLIDVHGHPLEEATENNSRLWGRSALAGGVVKNPFALAVRGGIPFVMGTLFRKSALRPEWLVREIGGAYDCWLALHLARTGGEIVFVPSRVFRYRAHDESESARLHPQKAEPQIFIFSSLLKEHLSATESRQVRKTLAHFQFVLGRDRLYFGHRALARSAFAQSLRTRFTFKSCLAWTAAHLPESGWRASVTLWRRLRGIRQALPGGVAPSMPQEHSAADTQERLTISCVIPTLCRGPVVCETVEMLLHQSEMPHEIVVVDQTPGTDWPSRENLERWSRIGTVRWLRQREPSASKARNTAALAATGDVLLFLDDDVRIAEDFIGHYADTFARTGAAGVAGQVLEGDARAVHDLDPRAFGTELGWLLHFSKNYSKVCETSFMMSGNVALRRELYVRLGGMDENYERGAYREESDFAMRFRRAGYRLVYSPKCTIYHLGAALVTGGGARNWQRGRDFRYFHHCVGDWYFNLRFATWRTAVPLFARSLRYFVVNRPRLKRPWQLPVAACFWVAAAPVAGIRLVRGPRLLSTANPKPAPALPVTQRV